MIGKEFKGGLGDDIVRGFVVSTSKGEFSRFGFDGTSMTKRITCTAGRWDVKWRRKAVAKGQPRNCPNFQMTHDPDLQVSFQ